MAIFIWDFEVNDSHGSQEPREPRGWDNNKTRWLVAFYLPVLNKKLQPPKIGEKIVSSDIQSVLREIDIVLFSCHIIDEHVNLLSVNGCQITNIFITSPFVNHLDSHIFGAWRESNHIHNPLTVECYNETPWLFPKNFET